MIETISTFFLVRIIDLFFDVFRTPMSHKEDFKPPNDKTDRLFGSPLTLLHQQT